VTREFKTVHAVRERVPMLLALTGASGSGKTYSALRLATGMAEITGGKVIMIDTEARRSLHYADDFDFEFVEMDAPFSPADYQEAIEYATKGSKDDIVIVDSMSHEHEGPGGVLEMHDAECERLMKAWRTSRDKVQMSAWAEPKRQRKRLIQTILRMGVNAIFCFRAKEKMDLSSSKPKKLGWMPVGGEEYIFDMLAHLLLYPKGGGVPVLNPHERAEDQMVKVPGALEACFPGDRPLDEEAGRKLARWAAGDIQAAAQASKAMGQAMAMLKGLSPKDAKAKMREPGFKALTDALDPKTKETLRDRVQDLLAAAEEPAPAHSDPEPESAATGDPAAPDTPEGEGLDEKFFGKEQG